MTCPACGQAERQDRKGALFDKTRRRPLTLHGECPNGHAWHMPLVITSRAPTLCDCEAVAEVLEGPLFHDTVMWAYMGGIKPNWVKKVAMSQKVHP